MVTVDSMAAKFFAQVFVFMLVLLQILGTSSLLMMKIENSCNDTIWPVFVSKPHSPEWISKNKSGFALRPGESKIVSAPDNWAGTIWSRTYCRNASRKFTCATGDCGSYECPDGATVPAATTLADFTPSGVVGEYTYFVSLAKGFNRPMTVVPKRVESSSYINSCRAAGCVADLNKKCPKEVQVVLIGNNNSVIIGCNSACEAFKESKDHYCGRSSTYSDHFKGLCPNAQAFENDKTSNTTFECSSADYYDVHFCASSFPSIPPISELYRARSLYGYKENRTEENGTEEYGTEENGTKQVSRDDSGTSTRPGWIKILIGIFVPLGAALLSYLGYYAYCRSGDSINCGDFVCCNNICCCCNHSK